MAVEGICGLELSNTYLRINPAIPKDWEKVEIKLHNKRGNLLIEVQNPDHVGNGVSWIKVDGQTIKGEAIRFPGKGKSRHVVVRMGR